MVKYTCPRCGREFTQKGHYDRHSKKTTPCIQQATLERLVEEKVAAALGTKKDLGQYFTIAESLQQFVFDSVKHKGSLLLEPSFGAGHLLQKFLSSNPAYPMMCYELDTSVAPVVTFQEQQTIVYGDFTKQPITQRFKTIIGNPPYVKQSTGNLYIKFIEQCFGLLADDGELIFIVPSDFLKVTGAAAIIEAMSNAGSFTHFLFPHDERLFDGASVDVVVFRYEKGLHSKSTIVNGVVKQYHVQQGILTFQDTEIKGTPLENLFHVHVGLVSGRDEIYKQPFGNVEILSDKGRVDTFIFLESFPSTNDEINAHLRKNKDALMARKIRKFSEANWWEWGAPRNQKAMTVSAGKSCIYIRNMTRKGEVAFVGKVQYFGGALLCLIPKQDLTEDALNRIVGYLNSQPFQQDYIYSGRFKIGHKQVCCALLPDTLIR